MNDTNTTNGGYFGSKMRTQHIDQARDIITNAFGQGKILLHREILVNGVNGGAPSGGAWFNSTLELPNEIMMYGSYIYTQAPFDGIIVYRSTVCKTQLAAMKLNPLLICPKREAYWLRDIASDISFCASDHTGRCVSNGADGDIGVRPVFGIK